MPKKETFQTCLQAPWTSFRKALRRKLTRQGLETPHYKMWLNLWGVSRVNTSQTGKEKCMPKCTARQSSRHYSNVPFDLGINVWFLKLIYTEVRNLKHFCKRRICSPVPDLFWKKIAISVAARKNMAILEGKHCWGGHDHVWPMILYHLSAAPPKPWDPNWTLVWTVDQYTNRS